MNQEHANYLLFLQKKLPDYIVFPEHRKCGIYAAEAVDEQELFEFRVNRKGHIELYVCSFLVDHQKNTFLARVDLGQKTHTNPPDENGHKAIIVGPHIHIFREEYDDKWAYPLDEYIPDIDSNSIDLVNCFMKFCGFCNTQYRIIEPAL